jgi:hypothetical protein
MNEPLKIIQAVTFNTGEAWVLDRKPVLEYERHGDTIVGMDFPFFGCYFYQKPGYFKAFAGREFSITLASGEVVECNGQWWDGVTDKTRDLIGGELIGVTAAGIEDLRKCYVFTGYRGTRETLSEFREGYDGDVMPYWDYDKILKGTSEK